MQRLGDAGRFLFSKGRRGDMEICDYLRKKIGDLV